MDLDFKTIMLILTTIGSAVSLYLHSRTGTKAQQAAAVLDQVDAIVATKVNAMKLEVKADMRTEVYAHVEKVRKEMGITPPEAPKAA